MVYIRYILIALVFLLLYPTVRGDIKALQEQAGVDLDFSNRLEEIARIRTEFYQFLLSAQDFSADAGEVTKADVELKFDLLWARIYTYCAPSHRYAAEALNLGDDIHDRLYGILQTLEPQVKALEQGNEQQINAISHVWRENRAFVDSIADAVTNYRRAKLLRLAEKQRMQVENLNTLQFQFLIVSMVVIAILIVESSSARRTNLQLMARKQEVVELSKLDALTGVYNRGHMEACLKSWLSDERLDRVQLMYIDLDDFKNINDTFGHGFGDQLLKQAAARINHLASDNSVVARIGGDEFVLIVSDQDEVYHGETADRVANVLRKPYLIDGKTLRISASIGVAQMQPGPDANPEDLIKNADLALYTVKETGRDHYQMFEPAMLKRVEFFRAIECDLPAAIRDGEIEILYQPQIDVDSGRPIGVEALARWNHKKYGAVSPEIFVAAADKIGISLEFDRYVVMRALDQLSAMKHNGYDLRLSVNVTPHRSTALEFRDMLEQVLNSTGFDPGRLILELKEDEVMGNIDSATHHLTPLTQLGVSIAVDDFGTGQSNLGYFTQFKFGYLKIDQQFIKNVDSNSDSQVIVQAITAMAQGLGMKVIAEGVETKPEYQTLRKFGIHEVQGYLLARPLTGQSLLLWLEHYSGPPELAKVININTQASA